MDTITASWPAPARTTVLWAVSDGAFENHFINSTTEAAVWLTDEAMRLCLGGQELSLGIHLHDPVLGVLWDATADVADVFRATGWPYLDDSTQLLRASVISILKDILVSDETTADAPLPGIFDPQTYAPVAP